MSQQPRNSRRQKIEPLSWSEAALAPALKGMTSFLDVSAEDVRNGTFESFGPRPAETIDESAAVDVTPEVKTYPGYETSPLSLTPRHRSSPKAVTPITLRQSPVDLRMAAAEKTPVGRSAPLPESYPEVIPFTGLVSSPGSLSSIGHESDRTSAFHGAHVDGVTPGRGRSKVRRCVLAQDGHSLGEEAIYQVMWRSGKPENGDPNGSRSIRIGAADIGYKVNMAKKNVRQNISRLFEKLALEIMEDFETMNSQARLYRVFSYKQILERRRGAGLEYVLRNKGVVFCSPNGEELVSSPAYVSTPGDETSIRPAPPKKRRPSLPSRAGAYNPTPTPAIHIEESEDADLQTVVQALNRYWPVDQPAAVQLIRDCRRVRPDAKADEIAFFVREKLELTRQSRNITNPTGLILATVPNSFVGKTFEEFRGRMERQTALAAEEAKRRAKEQADLTAWLLTERERYESIAGDSNRPQAERDAAERRLRDLASWNP